MNHLSDYHQYLLAGKLANTLTNEESLELGQLFRDNADIQSAYDEMAERLPTEMLQDKFTFLDEPGFWKDTITIKSREKRNVISLFQKNAAAAIAVGLIIGIWVWLDVKSHNKNTALAHKEPGIQLRLADGNTIDLTKEKGNIKQGSATLINNSASLTYSVTGGQAIGINSVTVPAGMNYSITLSDGSEIYMNSVTQLDFPFKFSGKTREISLSGEAYCKIAQDKEHPFIVHLSNTDVTVLGTEFNANSYDGPVKIALVNGGVSLTDGRSSVKLEPGYQAVFDSSHYLKEKFNPKSVLSWREGLAYFDYADLAEIGKVLNRWFGVKVVVDNPALNEKRIKGVLNKNKSLDVFLDDLKVIAKINSSLDKDGTLHLR